MTKNSFQIKLNAQGREYMELAYNESTKKSDGTENNPFNDHHIILSQPQSSQCPVRSFKFYISKLADLESLFQQANPNFKHPKDQWYKRSPSGVNTIGAFLSEILHKAGLSYIFTNHRTKGTMATAMKRAGYRLEEFAWVLKHENLESLKHYLAMNPQWKTRKIFLMTSSGTLDKVTTTVTAT